MSNQKQIKKLKKDLDANKFDARDIVFNKHTIEGCFDMAGPATQGTVEVIATAYHVQNGKQNNDGSAGEIRISPAEFNDLLVYLLAVYGHQHRMGGQAVKK
mgnify:CR=1 FL=1